MSVVAAAVAFGCGESKSSSGNPSTSGGSASGGSSGASGNGSGGTVLVRGGSAGSAGASSGGTATCPTGGGGGADGGQAGDATLACGLIVYPTRVYGLECQTWMEENCCPLLEACAANPTCKTLVDCVNACEPPTSTCISCCGSGLVDVPAELDAIAACTKTGAAMPEGCDWPPD